MHTGITGKIQELNILGVNTSKTVAHTEHPCMVHSSVFPQVKEDIFTQIQDSVYFRQKVSNNVTGKKFNVHFFCTDVSN